LYKHLTEIIIIVHFVSKLLFPTWSVKILLLLLLLSLSSSFVRRKFIFEEETLFGRGCWGIFNKSNKIYWTFYRIVLCKFTWSEMPSKVWRLHPDELYTEYLKTAYIIPKNQTPSYKCAQYYIQHKLFITEYSFIHSST